MCRNSYQNCKCSSTLTPRSDGSCKYVNNEPSWDNTDDDTYDYTSNDDSGWSPYSLLGILTLGFIIPCCLALCRKSKQQTRNENSQAVELQPVPTTTRPVYQNTPSHFPVPVSVSVAVPQPQAQYIPTVDTAVPNIDTPLMEPSAPSIPDLPPPSYEQATNLPPSYSDVVAEKLFE